MLNELEIREFCKRYGFGYRYFTDNVIIMTGVDSWRLVETTTQRRNQTIYKIIVEHANKFGNKSGKIQFHTQRVAFDVEWIFDNIIVPHQTYSKVYEKAFNIKELLALA
ncbi:hypothetical protein ACR77J_07735 [Tissierella praeacuta]|uniref:hypothetical protein n=1 Tax=Tissierella praeacuta TaxID=43131 RepID=UPI003DA34A47